MAVANYLPVMPQVVNPSANLITSTNAWTLVQGTYIAAGGEDHLTLGNFRSDANTTAQGADMKRGYYYYDHVRWRLPAQPPTKLSLRFSLDV